MSDRCDRNDQIHPAVRVELIRRLDIFHATIGATRELLMQRTPLANVVARLDRNLRSRWWVAIAVIGGLLMWAGENLPALAWLRTAGLALWILGGGTYAINLLEHSIQSRSLTALDGRLWDQRDRWRTIGGFDDDYDELRSLHDPDIGVDLDSDEYRDWWRAAKQRLVEGIKNRMA